MKYRILVILIVTMLFSWQITYATSITERITSAQEEFQEVLSITPNEKISVMVFFTNDMALENIRDSLNDLQVTVKGFRHGTQSYAGGYSLRQGETLDEAIINYKRDHFFFLEKRIEIEDNTISKISDDDFREALIIHRKEAQQMKIDFEEKGLRIIGMELYGKAKHIKDFSNKNTFVRVIEIKHSKSKSAILPQE